METKTSEMFSHFVEKLGKDFDGRSIIDWAEQKFFIKPFNLIQISLKQTQICHRQIQKKYVERKILHWPDEWHKNQRRIFIQILLCFCKMENKHPISMDLEDWKYLSTILFNKNPMFLKFQSFTLLKIHRKIQWMSNDDKLVKEFVRIYGQGNWNQISKKIFYKSDSSRFFSSKQIRERWYNHISQKIMKGPWTEKEDILLMEHVLYRNKRWCQIVRILNKKRTQHMIKNRFKILMKKSFNVSNSESPELRELLRKIREKFGNQMKLGKKVSEEGSQSSIDCKNNDNLGKQGLQSKSQGFINGKEEQEKMVQLNVFGDFLNGKIPISNTQVTSFSECYIQLPNFAVFSAFPFVNFSGETISEEKANPFTRVNNQQTLPYFSYDYYNAFPAHWNTATPFFGYQYRQGTQYELKK